jgi:hypothetical protein
MNSIQAVSNMPVFMGISLLVSLLKCCLYSRGITLFRNKPDCIFLYCYLLVQDNEIRRPFLESFFEKIKNPVGGEVQECALPHIFISRNAATLATP